MTCPFCNDTDFDEVGLKIHLSNGHCAKYNMTALPVRRPRLVANVPPKKDEPR